MPNMGDMVCRRIEKQLPDFMGQVFERIALEWLWRENRNGRLPILFEEAGRWWGNDPRKKKQTEIDILAQNGDHEMLFCECKWRNEPMDSDVLDTLIERSELFPAQEKYLMLFTKRTFSDRLLRKAEAAPHVRLVCFPDMMS